VMNCHVGSAMQQMYHQRLFTDATVVTEGQVLHVHRAVLAAGSPVFQAMFSSPMHEGERPFSWALVFSYQQTCVSHTCSLLPLLHCWLLQHATHVSTSCIKVLCIVVPYIDVLWPTCECDSLPRSLSWSSQRCRMMQASSKALSLPGPAQKLCAC